MDLAETSLFEYMERRRAASSSLPVLPEAEAVGIVRAMAAALRSLHANVPKIIHRDLNPNNILRLFDGTWVLADFGLVKFIGGAGPAT